MKHHRPFHPRLHRLLDQAHLLQSLGGSQRNPDGRLATTTRGCSSSVMMKTKISSKYRGPLECPQLDPGMLLLINQTEEGLQRGSMRQNQGARLKIEFFPGSNLYICSSARYPE